MVFIAYCPISVVSEPRSEPAADSSPHINLALSIRPSFANSQDDIPTTTTEDPSSSDPHFKPFHETKASIDVGTDVYDFEGVAARDQDVPFLTNKQLK